MTTDTAGTGRQGARDDMGAIGAAVGGPGAPFRLSRVRGRHRRPRPRRVLLTAGGLALAAGLLSLVRLTPQSAQTSPQADGPGAAEAAPRVDTGPGDGPGGAATAASPGSAAPDRTGPSVLPTAPLPMGGIGTVAAPGAGAAPSASSAGTAGPTAPAPPPGTTHASGAAPGRPAASAGTPQAPARPTARPTAPAQQTRPPSPRTTPASAPPAPPSGGGGGGRLCLPLIKLCVGLR
ncbi:hypothetical protein ACFUCQ_15220 [Streptomyces sp. NPDC057197]|uniref:hypothetical protein n=1 Tax=Streptomyces sp. NPDC057197 TaxID=3346045 RepID=UPI00363F14F5